MNRNIRKYWKAIVFSLSILLFVLVVNLLLKDKIHVFDNYVYSGISMLRCDYLTIFFKFISFLCSIYFFVIITLLIIIFNKNKKQNYYIILNILLCFLLNQVAKLMFARSRPSDIALIIESGYSFPSGHSMVSLAFYGLFIYIIAHLKISKVVKAVGCILLAMLVLLIGISRIYLGVHYASDVLGGYALAMAYLIFYIVFIYNNYNSKN